MAKDPSLTEQEILVQSVCETMVPKLVSVKGGSKGAKKCLKVLKIKVTHLI